ncbi:protein phosphatase 1L-like [Babylonia areolata]|uniref:protein phosphatase 1L-like n=1 Tax=Babylonia areolata TaxID=304850 RepID=UPI003FD18A34
MTLVSVVSRFIRLYLFSTEMIVLAAFIFILYNFLPHVPMWKMMQSARVKMRLKVDGQNGTVPNGRKYVGKERTDDVSGDKDRVSWEMKRENVGVFAIQGRRPHMEDRFNVVSDFEHTGASIYGIFDGHGGEFAAEFVEKTLLKSLMIRLLQAENGHRSQSAGRMLTDQVLEVDKQLLKVARSTMPVEISGTTSLVALIQNYTLTVANTGDSRGVICDKNGKVIPLSFDHKPHQVKERMRIQQAGGFISFNGVWRVAGVLATSRALGDLPLKEKRLIIADPDILTFDLTQLEPRFMILATDGLWDYFSNEEAAAFVSDRLSEPHFGAKSLVLQAYYRGSLDNITVMVVDLSKQQAGQYQHYSRGRSEGKE